jgi:hypothetical protein
VGKICGNVRFHHLLLSIRKTNMLTLNLTVTQVNTILAALGQRPYVEVADLIVAIKVDAEKQLAPKPPEPTED